MDKSPTHLSARSSMPKTLASWSGQTSGSYFKKCTSCSTPLRKGASLDWVHPTTPRRGGASTLFTLPNAPKPGVSNANSGRPQYPQAHVKQGRAACIAPQQHRPSGTCGRELLTLGMTGALGACMGRLMHARHPFSWAHAAGASSLLTGPAAGAGRPSAIDRAHSAMPACHSVASLSQCGKQGEGSTVPATVWPACHSHSLFSNHLELLVTAGNSCGFASQRHAAPRLATRRLPTVPRCASAAKSHHHGSMLTVQSHAGQSSRIDPAVILKLAHLLDGDGYVNATALAELYQTSTAAYEKNDKNQRFLEALCSGLGFPVDHFIKEGRGGNQAAGRKYHPAVALDFARWCDPVLAVQLSEVHTMFLSGKLKTEHSQSMAAAMVGMGEPPGHWQCCCACMLLRMRRVMQTWWHVPRGPAPRNREWQPQLPGCCPRSCFAHALSPALRVLPTLAGPQAASSSGAAAAAGYMDTGQPAALQRKVQRLEWQVAQLTDQLNSNVFMLSIMGVSEEVGDWDGRAGG